MYEKTKILKKFEKIKNKQEVSEKIVNLIKLRIWENVKK